MARILFCWELGGGWGHLLPHVNLIRTLRDRGHSVVFAARDVAAAEQVLGPYSARVVPVPARTHLSRRPVRYPCTYAHVLHNVGYDDSEAVARVLIEWDGLFEAIKPDVAFFDYAPMAQLAATRRPVVRVLVGTGFTIPPDIHPLPPLHACQGRSADAVRDDEQRMVNTINSALDRLGIPVIQGLGALGRADIVCLRTVSELDHYPGRPNASYVGPAPDWGGTAPVWPNAEGKRIFAYLKSSPAVPTLLDALRRSGAPTLVHSSDITPKTKQQFTSATMVFSSEPLDMNTIKKECDAAALNGTHNTTLGLLLAGKPMVLLPQTLERRLVAENVARTGAGIHLSQPSQIGIASALRQLLEDSSLAKAAEAFAARYSRLDPAKQEQALINQLSL